MSNINTLLDRILIDNWVHFLRARDLSQILSKTEKILHEPILEIGCGDGFITNILRTKFKSVVAIDIYPGYKVEGSCIANAEFLPFKDNCFEFIFSSNVLEHINNLSACMNEMRRVSRCHALMVHTMPTPVWKLMQLVFHPYNLMKRIAFFLKYGVQDRGNAKYTSARDKNIKSENAHPMLLKIRMQFMRYVNELFPKTHGADISHIKELVNYRRRSWIDRFNAYGYNVIGVLPLYFHSPYRIFPYRFLRVREKIAKIGFTSVAAYWVTNGKR